MRASFSILRPRYAPRAHQPASQSEYVFAPRGPTFLCKGNSLPLPLLDQFPFELGNRAITLRSKFAIGESSPVNVRFSFTKHTLTLLLVSFLTSKSVKVASQSVHRMAKHCVAFANEVDHLFELRPVPILARDLVCKPFVQLNSIAFRYLCQYPRCVYLCKNINTKEI